MKGAQDDQGISYCSNQGHGDGAANVIPGGSGGTIALITGIFQRLIDTLKSFNLTALRLLFTGRWHLPVILCFAGGLIAFSHFLSWIFRKYRDETIATMTGFILGSVLTLWPWKQAIYRLDAAGNPIIRSGGKLVEGYTFYLPDAGLTTLYAVCFMVLGIVTIWITESLSVNKR